MAAFEYEICGIDENGKITGVTTSFFLPYKTNYD